MNIKQILPAESHFYRSSSSAVHNLSVPSAVKFYIGIVVGIVGSRTTLVTPCCPGERMERGGGRHQSTSTIHNYPHRDTNIDNTGDNVHNCLPMGHYSLTVEHSERALCSQGL